MRAISSSIFIIAFALIIGGCAGKEQPNQSDNQDQPQDNQEQQETYDKSVESMEESKEDETEDTLGQGDSSSEMSNMSSNDMQIVYFDFDKYDIKDDMIGVVDNNYEIIMSKEYEDINVKLEGNTDEWGTDEYNYALGLKRAVAVKSTLMDKGVPQDRISVISYGESKPVCSEKEKGCWKKNRRVEVKLAE